MATTTLTKEQVIALQKDLVKSGYMTQAEMNTGPGIFGPRTQAAVAKQLASYASHPATKEIIAANGGDINKAIAPTLKYQTMEEALNAAGGDPTKMTDLYGQPFSQADQQAAYAEAASAIDPGLQAAQNKELADTEASLKSKQDAYNNYLQSSGAKFQEDKNTLDQTAADRGVLFSGGRLQKQTNLQNSYQTDQASKLNTLTSGIGQDARDYQAKYGQGAAGSLSNYYNAGGNTYNAGVASGGVGSTGLSSVYNPNQYNFGTGSAVTAGMAAKQQRAAGLLWNKGNKLVAGGLNGTYNR
jgi:hypothetical protein